MTRATVSSPHRIPIQNVTHAVPTSVDTRGDCLTRTRRDTSKANARDEASSEAEGHTRKRATAPTRPTKCVAEFRRVKRHSPKATGRPSDSTNDRTQVLPLQINDLHLGQTNIAWRQQGNGGILRVSHGAMIAHLRKLGQVVLCPSDLRDPAHGIRDAQPRPVPPPTVLLNFPDCSTGD